MPVPVSITDLALVAASNYPAGSDSPSSLDDTQRAHASFIALLRDSKAVAGPLSASGITGAAASGPLSSSGITGAAASGANSDITSLSGLTTPLSILQGGTGGAGGAVQILSQPNPTLAASALTLPASTLSLAFRSATASDGVVPAMVTGTVAALVIPSTATLGTVSAVASSIIEVVMNNAGTLERAVVNLAGGNDLTETGFISTTAISATATSASVFYSNTARTNLPYRVVRRIDSTQATAGAWVTSPSLVQGVGGQALTAMSSLGYGQKRVDVTASRVTGTTYYNMTGRTIFISVTAGTGTSIMTIGGVGLATTSGTGNYSNFYEPVSPGASYVMTGMAVIAWVELR